MSDETIITQLPPLRIDSKERVALDLYLHLLQNNDVATLDDRLRLYRRCLDTVMGL